MLENNSRKMKIKTKINFSSRALKCQVKQKCKFYIALFELR